MNTLGTTWTFKCKIAIEPVTEEQILLIERKDKIKSIVTDFILSVEIIYNCIEQWRSHNKSNTSCHFLCYSSNNRCIRNRSFDGKMDEDAGIAFYEEG
jgi:hypothetical protein